MIKIMYFIIREFLKYVTENSSRKAPGCSSFSFAKVRVAPIFKMTSYAFPESEPERPILVFSVQYQISSVVQCQDSSLGQLDLKSAVSWHTQFLIEKRRELHTFGPKFTCA